MEIVSQSHKILTVIDRYNIYRFLEDAGRICYQSEGNITLSSAEPFLRKLILLGHESVLEHFSITVRFITDRGVTHEEVRHRISSYSQESTRWCNYGNTSIKFIKPVDFNLDNEDIEFIKLVESHYKKKIAQGRTPQQARYFLINGLKTEIVHTANVREWRLIFRQRAFPPAHPQMQALMKPLLDELIEKLPVLFDDIKSKS